MYVNYCIWLEVISWSWISAEHQVESFLLANQSITSHFLRLLYDETHINLFSLFCLAPSLTKGLVTCTAVGPERIVYQLSSEQRSVWHRKACSDVWRLYINNVRFRTLCVCANKAELCHWADDAQMHRGCRLWETSGRIVVSSVSLAL